MGKRRWSGDRDKHFGPFLFAKRGSKQSIYHELTLDSGGGESDMDDETYGCHLRLQVRGHTVICELPAFIKPIKEDVLKDDGSVSYTETWSREYGATFSEEFVHLRYGQQTDSDTTSKMKTIRIPWLDRRCSGPILLNPWGDVFKVDGREPTDSERAKWASYYTSTYAIADYDGTEMTASVALYELVFRRGTGWWSWLSYFTRPERVRRMNIVFSKEMGPGKHTHKGGVLEASTLCQPDDTHNAAFLRYCNTNNLSLPHYPGQ